MVLLKSKRCGMINWDDLLCDHGESTGVCRGLCAPRPERADGPSSRSQRWTVSEPLRCASAQIALVQASSRGASATPLSPNFSNLRGHSQHVSGYVSGLCFCSGLSWRKLTDTYSDQARTSP